ncbi:MAG TPA: carbon storage regulator [Pirellulales bacterium]
MLVLSRKVGEEIVMPEQGVIVTIVSIRGNRVRIGVTAPRGVSVYRKEIDPTEDTPVGCAKDGCEFNEGR